MNIIKHLPNIRLYITFLLLLFAGNVNSQILIDAVIAVVNEHPITQSELIDEFRITTITDKPLSREPTAAEKRESLERIISRKLVLQRSEKIGITAVDHKKQVAERIAEIRANFSTDIAFQNRLKKQEVEIEALEKWIYEQVIYDAYYKRQFLNRIDSKEIDELAPQYFEANKSQFIVPVKVTFRSILITVPSDSSEEEKQAANTLAKQIYGRLLQDETYERIEQNFKHEKSISFSSLTLTTDEPLGAIVAELEPVELKGPIPVQEGYRIVELLQKTPARQKQYSEVKNEIANLIRRNKAETEFKEWLAREKVREPWYILDDALKRVSQIKINSTQ